MYRPALALAAAALFGLAACSDDSDGNDDATDATTTTTAAAGAASTSSTASAPAGPASSPEAAANGLLRAWEKGDRNEASRFARQRAITELFSHPNTGDVEYDDQGCSPQGGQFICSWTYPGGAMQMTVEGVVGTNGFVVDNVTYSAD